MADWSLSMRPLIAWLTIVCLPALLSAQTPLLTPEDLRLPGWHEDTDTAGVRKLLGPPLRTSWYTIGSDSTRYPTWVYPSLEVYFDDVGEELAVILTAPGTR